MKAIGLTGGIGCGKSAVAELLVQKGAVLIDADLISREIVEPGQPAYIALLETFGDKILGEDGQIDRPSLAACTFGDPEALKSLNAITHPAIGIEMLERLAAQRVTQKTVVLAIPLLRAEHRSTMRLDAVVVVDCPFDVALERLVSFRDMTEKDAKARIAAQVSREDRLSDADFVVDNSGDSIDLEDQVEKLWSWIEGLAHHVTDPSTSSAPSEPKSP